MSGDPPAVLRLRVIAPRRLLVDGEADAVQLPTLEGYIGILPGHSPLFVGLAAGTLSYRLAGDEESVRITGGTARVGPDEVVAVVTEPAAGAAPDGDAGQP